MKKYVCYIECRKIQFISTSIYIYVSYFNKICNKILFNFLIYNRIIYYFLNILNKILIYLWNYGNF